MSSDRRKISLVHNSKILARKEGRYLINKLIPKRDLTVVWGAPKSGKTFWALDIAFHIALGRSYRGQKVEKGSVVYCAFEGQYGLRDRVTAFHKSFPGSEKADFWLMLDRMTFNRPSGQATRKHRELITTIIGEEIRPALVILDTLNRSLDGSESSDEDMTFYTKAAEEIVDAFNCAVMIIHHCGINQERPRGHTSLTGTCSCQIAIRAEKSPADPRNVVSAQVEYIKDGPEGAKQFSFLNVIQIGSDEDGNEITSCTLERAPDNLLTTTKTAKGKQKSSQYTKVFEVLVRLSTRNDDGLVRFSEWREVAMRSNCSTAKNIDGKRKAFVRAVQVLGDEGKIQIDGEMVRVVSA